MQERYRTEKAYDIQKKMDDPRKKIDRRLTIGMSEKGNRGIGKDAGPGSL